jgi:hypothetical protein
MRLGEWLLSLVGLVEEEPRRRQRPRIRLPRRMFTAQDYRKLRDEVERELRETRRKP